MSESDLESPVESHRAMAEQVCRALGKCSASTRRDCTDDSNSLSLVERSVAAVEHSVGLVVYDKIILPVSGWKVSFFDHCTSKIDD